MAKLKRSTVESAKQRRPRGHTAATVRNAAVLDECQWFLNCHNQATGTMPHPILIEVRICDRCRKLAEAK